MTTITEILADAFNRVKTEHGVTLSRVDFAPAAGGALGLSFKAVGCHMESRDPLTVGEEIHRAGFKGTRDSVDIVSGPLDRATHVGSIQGGAVKFWCYEDHTLYFHDFGNWIKLVAYCDAPHDSLVDELTPLDGSPPRQP